MKIYNCEQRSEEWHNLRLGRVTGTRIKDMTAGKPSTFENLCRKIVAEKITGFSADPPFKISAAMQHGIDTEEEARSVFEFELMEKIEEVGFIEKDEDFGVSPDGIIDNCVGVELKCPQPNTHIGYLMDPGNAWKAYLWQIQGGLWVSGFDLWYFVSYCPNFQEDKRLVVSKILAIPEYQDKITEKAKKLRARVK